MKPSHHILIFSLISLSSLVNADELKTDGKWRGSGGAALSMSSGNTRSQTLNVSADALRATPDDKFSVGSELLFSRSDTDGVSSTSANQWRARGRYDSNISPTLYGFSGLDFSHDQVRLLILRSEVNAGLGYHVIASDINQWNIFAGANYRSDQYSGSGVSINDTLRTSVNAAEILLGEESTHMLSASTNLKQRLTINSNQSSDKGNRIAFEVKLATSINGTLSLTVTLQDRYDTQAQAPIKKNDAMLFTGLNAKFGN